MQKHQENQKGQMTALSVCGGEPKRQHPTSETPFLKFPQGTVRFPYLSVGEPDHPRKHPRLIFQGVSANPSSKHCLAARPHHPRRRLALHHQARPQVGRGQWGSSVPLFLVIKIQLDIDVLGKGALPKLHILSTGHM